MNPVSVALVPAPVEARLVDGSKIFLTLDQEAITIVTAYGKLDIKLSDIQRIEFGIRVPEATARKIDAAMATLTSVDDKKAEAWTALASTGEMAYPALNKLAKHNDAAISRKAQEMIAALKRSTAAGRLDRIDRDIVHTEYSKLTGRIDSTDFSVKTPNFGPLKIKIGDLSALTQGPGIELEEVPVNVQPDPGYLSNYQQQIGRSFYFRVTGAAGGSVWGSDVYTTDSTLAAAAVHAGAVKLGQTGIVKVTILAAQNSYVGSSRNGITTSEYGPYSGSYKVSRVGAPRDE